MTQATSTTETNDLRHTILAHDRKGNPITINIRLNDECKNGHQDFAITGDIYEKEKPRTDRYFISGGCIHEEILKARPDLKIFVSLHLCDYKGIPMYAAANGFYHLRNGFNNTKPESPEFASTFSDYYRISANQFKALSECENELQYAIKLQNLGILAQWENEANTAIKLLEDMTGKKFLVDSKRTQFDPITSEQLKAEEEKQNSGFYSPEAKQQREEEKKAAILDKLEAQRDKEINEVVTEFEVKRQVLEIGGEAALNNCIYYDHSKQLAFNWRGYEKISQQLIEKIKSEITLPEGVTIKNEKA
jgi:calcineurin-like phosphoesterase family protein